MKIIGASCFRMAEMANPMNYSCRFLYSMSICGLAIAILYVVRIFVNRWFNKDEKSGGCRWRREKKNKATSFSSRAFQVCIYHFFSYSYSFFFSVLLLRGSSSSTFGSSSIWFRVQSFSLVTATVQSNCWTSFYSTKGRTVILSTYMLNWRLGWSATQPAISERGKYTYVRSMNICVCRYTRAFTNEDGK